MAVLSAGGALGVNARYWLGLWMSRWVGPRFPWPTMTINVSGSLAIGFLATLLVERFPHPQFRLFVLVGFLGGYTTFSTYVFEAYTLWERGQSRLALANLVGSVVAGVLAVALGVALARAWIGPAGPGPPRFSALDESSEFHTLPEPDAPKAS